ncbi:hypothetical protein AVV36_gp168 [Pectobacterium bacteriophage PM2]|uniref:Anti-restriction nuclease n=1 Tax=Pectobacterium bacteriophage PM2 TaxID=1429794 RepID=A0A0A0Q3N1_9CAUD|nr:hypothetical protein AVV36_gp168 [Pectobacterium bacteriophage PM2]AHY25242.1 hypothetical protein PM2_280 [Pectobacterium bacteriophage PM2]
MNKLDIINELRKCVEKCGYTWHIWFRGVYLGSIVKTDGDYLVFRDDDEISYGIRKNYMQAISSFANMAQKVKENKYNEYLLSEPTLKFTYKKPSLIETIKGLLKCFR